MPTTTPAPAVAVIVSSGLASRVGWATQTGRKTSGSAAAEPTPAAHRRGHPDRDGAASAQRFEAPGYEPLTDGGATEHAHREEERHPGQQLSPAVSRGETSCQSMRPEPAAGTHLCGGQEGGRQEGVPHQFEPGHRYHAGKLMWRSG